MNRVWRPFDHNGLRFYRVKMTFPNRPFWNMEKIVAATSPTGAAEIIRHAYNDVSWVEEPIITGHPMVVFQPESWTT